MGVQDSSTAAAAAAAPPPAGPADDSSSSSPRPPRPPPPAAASLEAPRLVHEPPPPHTIRFASAESRASTSTAATSTVSACVCQTKLPYETMTPGKPFGTDTSEKVGCAPISTLCMFCMNAAYAEYWGKAGDKEKTCSQYTSGAAQTLCKSVASAVSSKSTMETLYGLYGPTFGATAVYCRDAGCCAGKESV